MIFPAMFFALGFFCAGLATLILVPPLVRRSIRRAVEKENRSKVESRQQVQSGKDRLRAEHALRVRKLERTAEHWHNRSRKLLALNGKMKLQMARTAQDMDDLKRLADQRYADIMDLKHEIHQLRLLAAAPPSAFAPGNGRTVDTPHPDTPAPLSKAWTHRPAQTGADDHADTIHAGPARQTTASGAKKAPRLPFSTPSMAPLNAGRTEKNAEDDRAAMAHETGTTANRKNRQKAKTTQTGTPAPPPVQGLSQRIRAIQNPTHRH